MRTRHKIITAVATAGVITAAILTHQGRVGPDYIYPPTSTPLVYVPGVINQDIQTPEQIAATICNSAWSTRTIRPGVGYTNQVKLDEMKKLGITDSPANYELDHYISLELGGDPSNPQNLWPEPYNTQINGQTVGARQKDSVENYLHKQVCSGQMTLQEAQKEITSDWYAVYKRMNSLQSLGASPVGDPDDETTP